jgi:hypothetical protein
MVPFQAQNGNGCGTRAAFASVTILPEEDQEGLP